MLVEITGWQCADSVAVVVVGVQTVPPLVLLLQLMIHKCSEKRTGSMVKKTMKLRETTEKEK